MKKGSREDFWRSVKLGLSLAGKGWVPLMLEIDRTLSLAVDGHRCKVRLHASLDYRGSHAGGMIWPPKGARTDRNALERALREAAGPGIVIEQPDRIDLRRGVSRLEDFSRPTTVRGERLKLPPARLARLIHQAQGWLRSHQRAGWSGQSVLFRRLRRFRAEGIDWKWFSDLFFHRREGLYWNNFITSITVNRRVFRRLVKTGFYERVREDLERFGFRVSEPHPHGLIFDQDFLPSRILMKKAAELDEWSPVRD